MLIGHICFAMIGNSGEATASFKHGGLPETLTRLIQPGRTASPEVACNAIQLIQSLSAAGMWSVAVMCDLFCDNVLSADVVL